MQIFNRRGGDPETNTPYSVRDYYLENSYQKCVCIQGTFIAILQGTGGALQHVPRIAVGWWTGIACVCRREREEPNVHVDAMYILRCLVGHCAVCLVCVL